MNSINKIITRLTFLFLFNFINLIFYGSILFTIKPLPTFKDERVLFKTQTLLNNYSTTIFIVNTTVCNMIYAFYQYYTKTSFQYNNHSHSTHSSGHNSSTHSSDQYSHSSSGHSSDHSCRSHNSHSSNSDHSSNNYFRYNSADTYFFLFFFMTGIMINFKSTSSQIVSTVYNHLYFNHPLVHGYHYDDIPLITLQYTYIITLIVSILISTISLTFHFSKWSGIFSRVPLISTHTFLGALGLNLLFKSHSYISSRFGNSGIFDISGIFDNNGMFQWSYIGFFMHSCSILTSFLMYFTRVLKKIPLILIPLLIPSICLLLYTLFNIIIQVVLEYPGNSSSIFMKDTLINSNNISITDTLKIYSSIPITNINLNRFLHILQESIKMIIMNTLENILHINIMMNSYSRVCEGGVNYMIQGISTLVGGIIGYPIILYSIESNDQQNHHIIEEQNRHIIEGQNHHIVNVEGQTTNVNVEGQNYHIVDGQTTVDNNHISLGSDSQTTNVNGQTVINGQTTMVDGQTVTDTNINVCNVCNVYINFTVVLFFSHFIFSLLFPLSLLFINYISLPILFCTLTLDYCALTYIDHFIIKNIIRMGRRRDLFILTFGLITSSIMGEVFGFIITVALSAIQELEYTINIDDVSMGSGKNSVHDDMSVKINYPITFLSIETFKNDLDFLQNYGYLDLSKCQFIDLDGNIILKRKLRRMRGVRIIGRPINLYDNT